MRKKPKLVIGITGAFGSGCTTAAKYLAKKYKFKRISMSDIIRKRAKSLEKKVDFKIPNDLRKLSRLEMQNLGNALRKKDIKSIIEESIRLNVNPYLESKPGFVIETLRNPEEVRYFFNLPYSYIIAVFSPKEIRMARTKCNTKSQKGLFEDADARDSGEREPKHGQNVTDSFCISDFFIDNSSSKSKLYKQIDKFIDVTYNVRTKKPSTDEVMMSHAFALRLLSPCLQHKIGCVVTKEDHIIGSGWNGPPKKTLACKVCLRKISKECTNCHQPLERVQYWCSNCGKKNEKERTLRKHLDLCIAVHAEERAILQSARQGSVSLEGSTLYCTTFPCLLCAKKICEVGIRRVVYVEPYPYVEAVRVLRDHDINVARFKGFSARMLYGTYYYKE